MATYNDEGIVLRRIDYGEADRILTVLTRAHGKIGVIARGVRRPQSRLASRTDLFVRSHMQLAKGRGELDVLAQAEPIGRCGQAAGLDHGTEDIEAIEAARKKYHDEWIDTDAVKMMVDGVIESHTAGMLEPYGDDPSTKGNLFWDPQNYDAAVVELFHALQMGCGFLQDGFGGDSSLFRAQPLFIAAAAQEARLDLPCAFNLRYCLLKAGLQVGAIDLG